MAEASVLYKKRDGLATLTLNRPRALNALDTRLVRELADAASAAPLDPGRSAVVERDGVGVALGTGACPRRAASCAAARGGRRDSAGLTHRGGGGDAVGARVLPSRARDPAGRVAGGPARGAGLLGAAPGGRRIDPQ